VYCDRRRRPSQLGTAFASKKWELPSGVVAVVLMLESGFLFVIRFDAKVELRAPNWRSYNE
jgi:hypothetical protein